MKKFLNYLSGNMSLETAIELIDLEADMKKLISKAKSKVIEETKKGVKTGYGVEVKYPNRSVIDETLLISKMFMGCGVDPTRLMKIPKMKPRLRTLKELECIYNQHRDDYVSFNDFFVGAIGRVGQPTETLVKVEDNEN